MTQPDAYDEIVESATMTCSACPTQYEGKLKDGRFFYFRYRFGCAQFGVDGASIDAAVEAAFGGRTGWSASAELGNGLDGVLDYGEYQAALVRLYGELVKNA